LLTGLLEEIGLQASHQYSVEERASL